MTARMLFPLFWAMTVLAPGADLSLRSLDFRGIPPRFERHSNSEGHWFLTRGFSVEMRFGREIDLVLPGVQPVRMRFPGAHLEDPKGRQEFPFRTSYFRGDARATGVVSYGRIVYSEIYPGVDLLFRGTGDHVEFDFILQPGADADRIAVELEPVDRLVMEEGAVVASLQGIEFRLDRPLAYQYREGRLYPVSCRMELSGRSRLEFQLGDYDESVELVIDPVLSYSTFLGGGEGDALNGVVTDGEGNVYVAGYTESVNLPVSPSSFQKEKGGGRDIFVSRLDPSGLTIAYLTYIGGSGTDESIDLQVDAAGNVVLLGQTNSSDFPVENAAQAEPGGRQDGVILKLNPTGEDLIYSTYLGGSADEGPGNLALASDGVVFAVGRSRSGGESLGITEGAFQLEPLGGEEGFVAGLSANGSSWLFITFLGGSGNDSISDLAIGEEGELVLLGNTSSGDFPLQDPFQEERAGSTDLFVARMSGDGAQLLSSSYLGGRSSDTGNSVSLDPAGRIFLAGETSSSDFPVLDPIQSSVAGNVDLFAVMIGSDGKTVERSTYLGGTAYDSARDTTVDSAGRLVFVGVTTSTDFPPVNLAYKPSGNAELLVAILDLRRPTLDSVTYLGGSDLEIPTSICETDGGYLVTGVTQSLDFPMVDSLQERYGSRGVYFAPSAASGSWQGAGTGLEDPNVEMVLVDPNDSDVVYAGTSEGGLFRSLDSGLSWEHVAFDGSRVLSMAVEEGNSDHLYIGTGTALYFSPDGGEEWETISDGSRVPFAPFTAIVIDPANLQTVYAAAAGHGVFKTTGANWVRPSNDLEDAAQNISDMEIHPQNTETLYLAAGDSVYKTTDGGANWEKTSFVGAASTLEISVQSSQTRIYAAGFLAQFGHFVARSDDGGERWEIRQEEQLPDGVIDLVVHPFSRATLVAATVSSGIFRSTDSGATWTEVNQGLGSRAVRALAIDQGAGARVYAGTLGGSDGFLARVDPVEVFYFPQVADGREGRIQFQTELVFVNTGEEGSVRVEFFDSQGNPLEFSFGDSPASSTLELDLSRGEAFSALSSAEGGLKVGYARVTASAGIDGTAIFSRTDTLTKTGLYEAGVPATRAISDFQFILDSLGDNDTGVALVNPREEGGEARTATVELTLQDQDGFLIDERTVENGTSLELEAGHHLAQFVAELFPAVDDQASEMRGVVSIRSDVPLVALTLRQRDSGKNPPQDVPSLTPFPVLEPLNRSRTLYFSQVADGPVGNETFQTAFILANPGSFASNVRISFFDAGGEPMRLDFGDEGAFSSRQERLDPGRFLFFKSSGLGDGEGGLQVGYARVTSSNLSTGGTAVFSQTSGTGVTLFEAGVAATTPRRRFSIFLDSLGTQDTGLALVNTVDETARVDLRLYDDQGNLLAEREGLELTPGQHLPRFIFQLFRDVAVAGEMKGMMAVESDQPLAAVTLRQKDDPDQVFPQEVPTLTTFPVVSGSPEE